MENGENGGENLDRNEILAEGICKASSFFATLDLDLETDDNGDILVDREVLFTGGSDPIAQALLALRLVEIEFPKNTGDRRTRHEASEKFRKEHERGLDNLENLAQIALLDNVGRPFSITGISTLLASLNDHLIIKAKTKEKVTDVLGSK